MTKLNILAIQELSQFALITFCVKKVITFCVGKLLHFALIILLHFALMLLHFVLKLHFAAIVITFCLSITFCADYYILQRNRVVAFSPQILEHPTSIWDTGVNFLQSHTSLGAFVERETANNRSFCCSMMREWVVMYATVFFSDVITNHPAI